VQSIRLNDVAKGLSAIQAPLVLPMLQRVLLCPLQRSAGYLPNFGCASHAMLARRGANFDAKGRLSGAPALPSHCVNWHSTSRVMAIQFSHCETHDSGRTRYVAWRSDGY
jgi:hypothetical protein